MCEKNIFKINENNQLDIIVCDNFYENPDEVRAFALSQKINIDGSFPGYRTIPFSNYELKNMLQEIVLSFGEIYKLHTHKNGICINMDCNCYSGAFFMNTVNSCIPWIHNDYNGDHIKYAAVIYLTPNAPISSGTSILQFLGKDDTYNRKYSTDKTKWLEVDRIGNKYNRIIIFNSNKYHLPNNYFGINNEDGRLTQVIWFSIKPYEIKDNLQKTDNVYESKTSINSYEFIQQPVVNIKSQYPCKLNNDNRCNYIIIDNFYENPILVRNFALLQKFYITGNFPGLRTKPFLTNEIIKKLDLHLSQYGINMVNIRKESTHCGSFQLINCLDHSRVVSNDEYDWIGIIYLTPDAPKTSGTSFYEYNNQESTTENMRIYSYDITKWKEIDTFGNVFNRCLLFNSKNWYMFKEHFGIDVCDSNLIQVIYI